MNSFSINNAQRRSRPLQCKADYSINIPPKYPQKETSKNRHLHLRQITTRRFVGLILHQANFDSIIRESYFSLIVRFHLDDAWKSRLTWLITEYWENHHWGRGMRQAVRSGRFELLTINLKVTWLVFPVQDIPSCRRFCFLPNSGCTSTDRTLFLPRLAWQIDSVQVPSWQAYLSQKISQELVSPVEAPSLFIADPHWSDITRINTAQIHSGDKPETTYFAKQHLFDWGTTGKTFLWTTHEQLGYFSGGSEASEDLASGGHACSFEECSLLQSNDKHDGKCNELNSCLNNSPQKYSPLFWVWELGQATKKWLPEFCLLPQNNKSDQGWKYGRGVKSAWPVDWVDPRVAIPVVAPIEVISRIRSMQSIVSAMHAPSCSIMYTACYQSCPENQGLRKPNLSDAFWALSSVISRRTFVLTCLSALIPGLTEPW